MVKILITTIQVNLMPRPSGTKFTWIVVIKIFPLTYHHSHFLAATLDFTSFFTMAFLGAADGFFVAELSTRQLLLADLSTRQLLLADLSTG